MFGEVKDLGDRMWYLRGLTRQLKLSITCLENLMPDDLDSQEELGAELRMCLELLDAWAELLSRRRSVQEEEKIGSTDV